MSAFRWQVLWVVACGAAMVAHGVLLWLHMPADWPLLAMLLLGGVPLLWGILKEVFHGDFGADVLAAIALVTAGVLGEYLAGVLIVLMLAGGQALESLALRRASSVLEALAQRLPTVAHRKQAEHLDDIALTDIQVGDTLVVYPHESCPVDGTVLEGHGTMDESYLTGEPWQVSKAPGSTVLSGAINGNAVLVVRVDKPPEDSRYAKIMSVMQEAEQRRPQLRRLGDQIGAVFAPLALAVAIAAGVFTGDAVRFLAVLVIATPCPLLIAIPITVISAISKAAKRGIIIKDPVVLERLPLCRTAIFDKTGTLTYGEPALTDVLTADGVSADRVLQLTASLERYSKHPLAGAILKAAEKAHLYLPEATQVSEVPGQGLSGVVDGQLLTITSRSKLAQSQPQVSLPPVASGLECVVLLNGQYAATLRLHDTPRTDSPSFIEHLQPAHAFEKVMLVSGDRESEVRYLADWVGIKEVYASQTPEQKLAIVRAEAAKAPTLFMGDGINDAPALAAATVGLAFGQQSAVTSESAGAVILESTLRKVDELLHLSMDMRRIALQSAVGGMVLSVVGMGFAAAGFISPVMGAILQEVIDVLAIANALRLATNAHVSVDID
jgi:heavy metal translocating P-type ATPase